jgi:hypothetical protein
MDPTAFDLERTAFDLDHIHRLARLQAQVLRRQAFARFWTNVHTWLTALVTGNGPKAKTPVNQHPGA